MEFEAEFAAGAAPKFRIGGLEFFQEVSLRTAGGSAPFALEAVDRAGDGRAAPGGEFTATWRCPAFGRLRQTWRPAAGDFSGAFSLEALPDRDLEALIVLDLAFAPRAEPYFMIPGCLYGTNNIRDSKGLQPQLNYRGEVRYPRTPVIRTRADRSTHNAVIAVADGLALGLRIDESSFIGGEPFYNGLGVDTRAADGRDRLSLLMGYHHFPVRYRGKLGPEQSHSKGPEFGFLPFKKGEPATAAGHFRAEEAAGPKGHAGIVRHFYAAIHQAPGNAVGRDAALRSLGRALVEDAYDREHKYFPTIVGAKYEAWGLGGTRPGRGACRWPGRW